MSWTGSWRPVRPLASFNMDLPDIDSLWNYQDPAASERAFLELMPQAREDDAYFAQLLTQLARSQVLQRRYEDGHATLDQVAALLTVQMPVARVRYLLERGRTWNDTNKTDAARQAFEEAYRRAIEGGLDALAVDSAHMLGVMEPLDGANDWNRRAIEIAQASADPRARRWVGTLFINLGSNLQQMENFREAERAFQQAIAALEAIGNLPRARLARLCLAKNRRLAGDPAEALSLLVPLVNEIRAAGDPEGYAEEEMAECCLSLGRTAEAKKHFARAYTLLSVYPWFPPTEMSRLERLKALGGVTGEASQVAPVRQEGD
jgi:tetratricopeptide (TPR) repeat protein